MPGPVFLCLGALLVCLPLAAQAPLGQRDLAPGLFLVSKSELPDPNFQDTVVLLIQYSRRGAMGLIINRPSKIRFSRMFPELPERNVPIYFGGPVETGGALALVRSAIKPGDAEQVLDEVYLISSQKLLESTLTFRTVDSSKLHIYLGYSGWGSGQLDREVELGAWHIFRADTASIFDPEPAGVYPRFHRRTQLRIALLPRPGAYTQWVKETVQ